MAEQSDLPEVFATDAAETTATTTVDVGAGKHVEPELLGLAPYQWVSLSMVVLLLIAFFGAKVHKTIAGGLDNKIAAIRDQLEEAKTLRAEAEALRDEYASKIANAEKDAEAMLDNARVEADAIVAKAEADTKATIARRKQMAEDKIAAAERDAIQDLKARAADAATAASRKLIAEEMGAESDRAMVDSTIAQL
ncbi:hypothetical protein [Paraurantiacibacter namhicola]|uniref:ATP synthase subunit b n=1 Tax=Paraurantiacibacter namhicola TaxID=645517 RepID=A0A1C7D8H0_9SPHN|nr:hypothetical protein [Paraurantiacibacter namhicola]ANU07748.1 ATP synthase subunit b precursor [Paraurantiacibacter namhicola]